MATSKESELLKSLFTSISTNNPSPDSNNLWLERALYETVTNVAAECPEVTYEDRNTTDNGRIPYKWILPARSSKRHVMLFMHGGGFSFGSTDSHRKLAAHLASACGIPAASVEYKLTPEFQHPRQIDDCIRVYEHLLSAGYHPENIALCGDSCGGGLVSTVPLALGRQALPKPGASVALSPWFDHTASGETHQTNADVDAIKFGNDLAAR